MLEKLFNIFIQPIIYVLELVFSIMFHLTHSQGISIIGVSIVVNLLCLPLYGMADAAQERERKKQKSMERFVSHIKKTFDGDEQYMMLSAYYEEQNYHPASALVGSLSLLLQIPFFMAAYTYLSDLELLRGASFLMLQDLGAPDAMLQVGAITLNVLPVLMTTLNCVSTAIYTRGLPLRDKLQAYILAVVFLFLLYDSPSGLVFYWTCNQLFSLGKNVFMKLVPNPGKWALLLADACVALAVGWMLATGKVTSLGSALFVAVAVAVMATISVIRLRGVQHKATEHKDEGPLQTPRFFAAASLLSVLFGVLIPSAIIGDNPTEFVAIYDFVDPMSYVIYAACVWTGVFVVWIGVYFFLSSPRVRALIVKALWCLCGITLVDYFVFPPQFGIISVDLAYGAGVVYPAAAICENMVALAAVTLLLLAVWKYANKLVLPTLCVLAIALAGLAVPNIVRTRTEVAQLMSDVGSGDGSASGEEGASGDLGQSSFFDSAGNPKPLFSLSRTGKNVVVVFLDRAMSGLLPYVFDERPELVQKFDGFTYYPNTLSFGQVTLFGAPAMYGGYEYSPMAMNARANEMLADKYNESLLVMPRIFSSAGYATTVIDPPYAGYKWVSDLSIYDGLDNTKAYYVTGAYTPIVKKEYGIEFGSANRGRTFFFYSLFRTAPRALQGQLYDSGNYHSTRTSTAPSDALLDQWSTLHLLPALAEVTDAGNNFVVMGNCTTHEPDFLSLPDYVPASFVSHEPTGDPVRTVDGKTIYIDTDWRLQHYHVNASSYLQLGRWFDWMREQGVYDNTRIVVVSDHGYAHGQFPDEVFDDRLDVEGFNPLLMVKDYDSHGFETSPEFMTNGDVPMIATKNLADKVVNPFTGAVLDDSEKLAHEQVVTTSTNLNPEENNSYVYDTSDAPWYAVHDNIFDLGNWRRLEE